MPEKLGNGGNSLEKYNPEDGKYIADGKPNKYYDNPEEKITPEQQTRLNNLNFFRDSGLIDEDEYNESYNEIFKKTENFDKKLSFMKQEELLKEISLHEDFFSQKGIEIVDKEKFFNNDLKLKCANFRKLHELMDKYPVDLNGLSLSWNAGLDDNVVAGVTDSYNPDGMYLIANELNINPNFFKSFNSTITLKTRQQEQGFTMHVSDDEYELATSFITHEYGHILHHKITEDKIKKEIGFDKWLDGIKEQATYLYTYGKGIKEKYDYEYESEGLEYFIKDQINASLQMEYNGLFDEIESEIYKKLDDRTQDVYNIYYNNFSQYGKTSPDEAFAELFASLEGGKPTQSALFLGEWLKNNGHTKGE